MVAILPLAIISFVAMWLFFFVGLIFYEEGDDKRTLLFSACVVIDVLAVFSLLIPTYTTLSIPAYNITTTSGNTISVAHYPAINETTINPPLSNSVITLYTTFAVFQGIIFMIFAIWSLRYRLQYQTTKQYKREMHH
ncbi:MAG: hypothetical protein QXN16_00570 [Candidatus Micrarchaeaceae archaeon]